MSNGIGKNPLIDISKVYLQQIANEGTMDIKGFEIPKKEQEAAAKRVKDKTAAKQKNIRGNVTADQKARLEKKRGMKLDDHPQFKKEEMSPKERGESERIRSGSTLEMGRRTKDAYHKIRGAMIAAKQLKRDAEELKKEEVAVDEAVKGQDTEMRKSASAERKSGDKRLPPSAGKGYADQQKQSIAYMDKKTKNNKIVVGMTKEGLDPVGKEDGDVNNDGKKDSTDSYLMKRRKAIGNAMKKKMKEQREFAEESLTEVMTDEMDDKPIKEKKVKNKITINPKLGEAVEELGGTLIEEIEVDEFDVIVETVYEELIEEGFSEDEVEYGIETALNTLDEGYYDSAVASSKAAAAKNRGEAPKKSMKDRLKSAAKKAIGGTARAVGKAMKAKAAVQAAPEKAKSKLTSMADRVKRIAKAGYESGRGPVEKKSKGTSYRGTGVGRKEKIGEERG